MNDVSNQAVFLSYASQDAAAARGICEALRAAGVEVWFDQSELRGGDSWDQKIRKQIRECALFVPIISANTQARLEGYFRLEWKLAEDRSHLMARGKAFIVPVVVDGTTERDAHVPDAFLAVQWTRLSAGDVPAAFVARVQTLLGDGTAALPGRPNHAQGAHATPAGPTRRRRWPWAALAAAGAITATAMFIATRPSAPSASPNAQPQTQNAKRDLPANRVEPKTIAVLAFDNLSDDKTNESFSDGISEELINALGRVAGLTVKGRTSSFFFKGRNVSSAEIAQKLDVSYLVRGGVRKSGNKVRITAQLTRAATDELIWSSEPLERPLENAWAVQEEFAGLIAKNLQLKLGAPARRATVVNPEAHRLILEGRHFWRLRTDDGFARAETDFSKAVELDPRWAPAHAALADLWAIRGLYRLLDGGPFEEDVVRARAAAARALELDAELPDPHSALGLLSAIEGRGSEARAHFTRALALAPNHAGAHDWLGDLEQSTGRLDLALQEYGTAAQLDPLSPFILADLCRTLPLARRFAEALEMLDRAEGLQPGRVRLGAWRAHVLLQLGRREDAAAALQAVLPKLQSGREDGGEAGWVVVYVLRALGREAEAREVSAALLRAMPDDRSRGALLRFALGETEQALALIERAPNTMTIAQDLFWHPMFDPIREQPRFQQMLVKLGRAEQYQVARETLARMLKEQPAKK